MWIELPSDHIGLRCPQFLGLLASYAVASIAAGNTAGRLWEVRAETATSTLLLWDQGNNVFYLTGAAPDEPTRHDLARLIAETIRPVAFAQGLTHFKLRALSPALEELAPALFAGVALRETASAVYLLGTSEVPAQPEPELAGLRLAPIERALLEQPGLRRREEVLAEIGWMWPEEARFFAQGFGVAACLPGELIGWCTAEYVSQARCGVGIATAPEYRGRGVAAAMAAWFVRMCRRRGIAPLWETGVDNLASRRVAEKVGFRLADEERTFIGAFTPIGPRS